MFDGSKFFDGVVLWLNQVIFAGVTWGHLFTVAGVIIVIDRVVGFLLQNKNENGADND